MDPMFVGPHGIWVPISDGVHNQLVRIDPSTNQIALKIPINGVVAVADWSDGVWAAADTKGAFSLDVGAFHPGKRLVQIDPLTGKILRTINLGPAAYTEQYTPDGFTYRLGSLWAIVADHEVDRVDPESGRVTAAIRTPAVPLGMTSLAFVGTHAFVAEDDGTIARIDAATNCVDGVVYIGGRSHPFPGRGPVKAMAVATGPDGLYVSFDGGALALVDPANLTVVKSVRVDDQHGLNTATDAFGSVWYPTFDNGTLLRLKLLA